MAADLCCSGAPTLLAPGCCCSLPAGHAGPHRVISSTSGLVSWDPAPKNPGRGGSAPKNPRFTRPGRGGSAPIADRPRVRVSVTIDPETLEQWRERYGDRALSERINRALVDDLR